jgi:hypothetical protein
LKARLITALNSGLVTSSGQSLRGEATWLNIFRLPHLSAAIARRALKHENHFFQLAWLLDFLEHQASHGSPLLFRGIGRQQTAAAGLEREMDECVYLGKRMINPKKGAC